MPQKFDVTFLFHIIYQVTSKLRLNQIFVTLSKIVNFIFAFFMMDKNVWKRKTFSLIQDDLTTPRLILP